MNAEESPFGPLQLYGPLGSPPRPRQIDLERVTIGRSEAISRREIANMTVEVVDDFVHYQLVARFKAQCWAEGFDKGREWVEFESPATWWEHFKLAYVPAWLLKRWPVRMKKEKRWMQFRRRAFYPSIPLETFGQNHAYTVVNTISEIPRCFDANITGLPIEEALRAIHRTYEQAHDAHPAGREPKRIAMAERTWCRFCSILRPRFPEVLDGVVQTAIRPEFQGRPIVFDEMIPEGIVRFVVYG